MLYKSLDYKGCIMYVCKRKCIYILAYAACKLCSEESGGPPHKSNDNIQHLPRDGMSVHNQYTLDSEITALQIKMEHYSVPIDT